MDNTWVTIIQWVITILGLLASIVGGVLAIFTFISPFVRLKWYLKKADKWKKVYLDRYKYNWQYKNHPEFTIEVDEESQDWSTTESWMTHYPDSHKSTSFVKAMVNGRILLTENFISLDGGGYFVPVPKRAVVKEIEIGSDEIPEYKYWYTTIQVELARIVSSYYRMHTIEEFMESHHLAVSDDEDDY